MVKENEVQMVVKRDKQHLTPEILRKLPGMFVKELERDATILRTRTRRIKSLDFTARNIEQLQTPGPDSNKTPSRARCLPGLT